MWPGGSRDNRNGAEVCPLIHIFFHARDLTKKNQVSSVMVLSLHKVSQ